MTREKLQTLSMERLQTVARREGIHNQDSVSKNELIELILEALEEDEDERRSSNNSAMRLEHKKYDILKDEEVEALQQEHFPLPERYNDTRLVLLLRDPEWAFAYWDINEGKKEKLQALPNYEGFFLRVYEYLGEHPTKENLLDYFDIGVGEEDDSRYINLHKPGIDYRVELFSSVLHREESLAVSNPIHSPLGFIARNKEDFYRNPNTMMLMLSGLWDYGSEEEEQPVIPQRIISILDSHDFEVSTD